MGRTALGNTNRFLGAKSGAGFSLSKGINFSALAYVASATGKVDLGFLEVSATGYLGAVGIEFAQGQGGITVGAAPNGVGVSITICWDNE